MLNFFREIGDETYLIRKQAGIVGSVYWNHISKNKRKRIGRVSKLVSL